MKVLSRAGRGPLGVLIAFFAAVALVLGVTSVAVASPGTGEEVNFEPTERCGLEVEGDILKINDTLGYGWCIDLGSRNRRKGRIYLRMRRPVTS